MTSHAARLSPAGRTLRTVYNWLVQFSDPVRLGRAFANMGWFVSNWHRYRRMPGAERIRIIDTLPQLHDRTVTSQFDAHYFYANGWAARRILANPPRTHVDIASQIMFANMLAAAVPVLYVDYRPLLARLPGLCCLGGSLIDLPFSSGVLESISCLHVLEHVGLGRYGDPLDPEGTRKAAQELVRVLAPAGHLYVALPIGAPRLCFNAHRIFAPQQVLEFFAELQLLEFGGVDDAGRFYDQSALSFFTACQYGCGLYAFRKRMQT